MHVPITTVSLILLTLSIFLLRIFWLHVPATARIVLVRLAIVFVIVHILSTATKWETTSDRVNVLIKWFAIAGYEMLLMLFSLLRPRWLTSVCAFILLIPIFASSILMPLTFLFTPSIDLQPIDNNLAYQRVPWGDPGDKETNSGVDLIVYKRPRFIPFLRHNIQHVSFNNQECNANASFVLPGADSRSVVARCPHWSTQDSSMDDRILSMR